MNNEHKFKDNDLISFEYGELKGTGFVKGLAIGGMPVIGETYIIQVIQSKPELPNKTYPFHYIVIPEIHLHKTDDKTLRLKDVLNSFDYLGKKFQFTNDLKQKETEKLSYMLINDGILALQDMFDIIRFSKNHPSLDVEIELI